MSGKGRPGVGVVAAEDHSIRESSSAVESSRIAIAIHALCFPVSFCSMLQQKTPPRSHEEKERDTKRSILAPAAAVAACAPVRENIGAYHCMLAEEQMIGRVGGAVGVLYSTVQDRTILHFGASGGCRLSPPFPSFFARHGKPARVASTPSITTSIRIARGEGEEQALKLRIHWGGGVETDKHV